ncbi:hypothetical protein PIB30_076526 [Stylosanthes scabra]|uniref:F-box domain-containing protein n=1 Tax=Stylosanthes scabra TaxID=79078 RepID=A0ABU6VPT3_9FABA|nr:hypothetical protein [Stylosanthes scabra]
MDGDDELYKEELPEEMIRQILVRLPVRFLIQLRSVCRSWNSLISSHEFAIHHLQRSTLTHSPPLLCWNNPGTTDSQSFLLYHHLHHPTGLPTSVPIHKNHIIGGSCNGLLCLSEQDFPFQTLTLFNPSTRSASPSIPFESSHEFEKTAFWGFGYDILHDKYKFVTGCSHSSLANEVRSGAKLCIFGANPCWKNVDHPVFVYNLLGPKHGILVSGTLNWTVYGSSSSAITTREWFVLTFDLETESFGRLSLPIIGYSHYTNMPRLQVLNNRLSVCYRYPSDTICCSVWIMKEHGVEDSWTKLLEIPRGGVEMSPFIPLYISEEDRILLAMKESGEKLFEYNLRESQMVYPMSDMLHPRLPTSLYLCHESLLSPSLSWS